MMKTGGFLNMLIAVLFVPLCAFSQQRFPKVIPAGNYSGICALGNDRYAVVSDKSVEDGFFVFRLVVDTLRGRIVEAANEGFRSSGLPNCDMEGICFYPPDGTVFVANEQHNEVNEYTLDGQRTGRKLALPDEVGRAHPNYGLESLCYDDNSHRFFTATERPLPGDSLLHIYAFDEWLRLSETYYYRPDPPISRKYYYGVSEICALGDGRLLVLERQLRVPRLKIGAKAVVRLYEVRPSDGPRLEKQLLCELRSTLGLTSRKFANYEGLCLLPGWLLLVADSQNQYKGVLRDWFKLVPLEGNH